MNKFTLDENHIYRLDGVIIPGCSEILKSCGVSDYSAVPKNVLEASAQFGRAVHSACELWDKATLDMENLSAPLIPYLDVWKQFLDDYKPGFLFDWIETPTGSIKHRFGCTPDRVFIIRDKVWILEIKTTSSILPSVSLQLAAQSIAVSEHYGKVNKRAAIQLTDSGYKLFPFDNPTDESVFLNCLKIQQWKERNL